MNRGKPFYYENLLSGVLINDELKPIQKKILDLAEEAIQQKADTESLQQLYRETEGTAIATDTVGLRQGKENAPAYLAARECINPDALEGAIQAARFHRLWDERRMSRMPRLKKSVLKQARVPSRK